MKFNRFFQDTKMYRDSIVSEVQPKNSTEIEISVPIEFAKFDGTQWIDNRTKEELLKEKENQLLQLNLEYTEIIDERERLKLEYNNLKQLIN